MIYDPLPFFDPHHRAAAALAPAFPKAVAVSER